VLEDALEDEVLSEKPDSVKHFSTLVIFSPHAGILILISLTTNPTNAGPDSFWASASHNTLSNTSGLLSILL
jgi:hypothetical protein